MNIKIIYETQTGTTQYVAETLHDVLATLGHNVKLHSLRYDGSTPTIEDVDVVIFGAPTYEDGKLETAMRVFIARFSADLSKHKVAVFGLGNSSYPQFCSSARILEEWVKKSNGTLAVESLRVDGFPDDLSPIENWAKQLAKAIS